MGEATRVEGKASESQKEKVASQKQKTDLSQSISLPTEQILFLQRTIGNQAVGRLIKSEVWQAKLRVSRPDEIYEQEADRVAEQVLRMPQASNRTKIPEGVSKSIPEVSQELKSSLSTSHGGGQPLPESVRAYMEPRFGADFSHVRTGLVKNSCFQAIF